jgi:hypothetical protein
MVDRSEKAIMNDCLIEGSALQHTMLWRNNTGMAWAGTKVKAMTGSTIRVEPGMVILRNARPLTAGLPGSGDILGTIKHVQTGAGVPVSGEIKTLTGSLETTQIRFKAAWERAGGVFIKARSPEEFVRGLRRARGE